MLARFASDDHKATMQQICFLSLTVHEMDTSLVKYYDTDSDRDWAENQMLPPALRLQLLYQRGHLRDSHH